jgi:hypothetical protein
MRVKEGLTGRLFTKPVNGTMLLVERDRNTKYMTQPAIFPLHELLLDVQTHDFACLMRIPETSCVGTR